MNGKPVIVLLALSKPMVFSEFEKDATAIVVNFGVQNQAILDVLTGVSEPSGLLPVQMPADMKTVELQSEDIPHDLICYTDASGHTYDFGFGMNWKGVIKDARTAKYISIEKPGFSANGNVVTIINKAPGTKVYYTVDGTTPPFVETNLYTKPFNAKDGAIIKAIAKKYGVDNSSIAVYAYTGKR
jgi:beta-glucosidase